ncbi:hypothetical protein M422DRAFT_782357 [Sphaerobolus stellatus SS14]|uniref:Uncharacterized protein n=1 Tax=Sphaerobolus stellatus (strain SS14) TaxID=990650 RepID=A0A0C9VF95_SPHS4|nr:hypothetical protein M422DRAFT_782357 [Sphaerobolus stellatus SS14]
MSSHSLSANNDADFRTPSRNSSDVDASEEDIATDLTLDDENEEPALWYGRVLLLFEQFNDSGEIRYLNQTITAEQRAIQLTPDGHPDKRKYLHNIGLSFYKGFEALDDLHDLENAIIAQQLAVDLTLDGHHDNQKLLTTSGILSIAIKAYQLAVNLAPDEHPDKPGYLDDIGIALYNRLGVSTITPQLPTYGQAVSSLNLNNEAHVHRSLATEYNKLHQESGQML